MLSHCLRHSQGILCRGHAFSVVATRNLSQSTGRSARRKHKNYVTSIAAGAGAVIGGLTLPFVLSGVDEYANEGKVTKSVSETFPEGSFVRDTFLTVTRPLRLFGNYVLESTMDTHAFFALPSNDKLLPDPMRTPQGTVPKTLVLELDQVLAHNYWSVQTGYRPVKRPGVDQFLDIISQYYEVVVFTKGYSMVAAPIIDALDQRGYISARLYRDATRYEDGVHYKDLSHLNRDLKDVILIDTTENKDSHTLQPDNVIQLKPWSAEEGDPDELNALLPFLIRLVTEDVPDVRPILKSYKGHHIPTRFKEQLKEMEEKRKKRSSARTLGMLGIGVQGPPGAYPK